MPTDGIHHSSIEIALYIGPLLSGYSDSALGPLCLLYRPLLCFEWYPLKYPGAQLKSISHDS